MTDYRIEKDSLGEIKVPSDTYWGAQTQRAIENFPISGMTLPPIFIHSLALIKHACASVNRELKILEPHIADAIIRASEEIRENKFKNQFPIDVFQTGSGTSTNMNVNEVIAARANELITGKKASKLPVHPNDHVNMGQSSNDVIPTSIHVSTYLEMKETLLPAIELLHSTIKEKAKRYATVVKTGRTHLIDALPITLEQEMSGWASQVESSRTRIESTLARLSELAIGGTAVGTGVNTTQDFGRRVVNKLSELTGIEFREATNHFNAQAAQDTITEVSGQLKTYATIIMKISNDIRWMNSGPVAGLEEIRLPALQPGSSMMPGKVNPVIPEAVRMVAAQVIGNDAVISLANAMGEFQLNVMLPVIAHNILESITILANSSRLLAEKAVQGFEVNEEHIEELVDRNPIIITILSPIIGYDRAAEVIKRAFEEKKKVKDIVVEMGLLSVEEADRILELSRMTGPNLSIDHEKEIGV